MNISTDSYRLYSTSFKEFRHNLNVDVDGIVRRLGEVEDSWQAADFAAMEPAIQRCNGRSEDDNAVMRAYLERPRGHSKTTDLAVICVWILAFATRSVRGYGFAADKDQATLLKDAMDTIVRLNPWLSRILEVQKNTVVNIAKSHPGVGGSLTIFTSDVASSYGILPDFVICDELCHWEGDGSLWHSIVSSAAKRSNCFLTVISNACFIDSWQWKVRETARVEESWFFSRLDGPVASWLTEKRLAEQRKMLPAIAYSRLWDNLWSSGGGDALTREDIDAAFIDGLQPMAGGSDEYHFVAGVDLGLVRDCAATVVLAVPKGGKVGKIRLAHNKLWKPIAGQKINLLEVERHLLEMDEKFNLEFIAFDPWQMEHLAQTIEADLGRRRRSQRHFFRLPFMREIPPMATNLRLQASTTIESFGDRRIQLYDCEPLRNDLNKLRVEEKSYGFRLVSPRDGEGHGDTFSAFANALLVAVELAAKPTVVIAPMGGAAVSYAEQFAARQRELEQSQQQLQRLNDEDPSGFLEACDNGTLNIITPS